MHLPIRLLASCFLAFAVASLVLAQTPGETPPPPAPTPKAALITPPPPADQVAASVNGQKIVELAVYRGVQRMPPQHRERARGEVLNFLIDNAIVDQYLIQLKISVDTKEVEDQIAKIKAEAVKEKTDFAQMLAKLFLTEDDLRRELSYALKWEKFVAQQGTEKVLKELFDKNTEMFNGTRVQAKHILISLQSAKKEEAQAKIQGFKKQVEETAAQEQAKLPATATPAMKADQRIKSIDKAFTEIAAKESTCPSKAQGGDLGYFPRIGAMVEPFAKAAFSLKNYEMSEPVATEFGVHLILATDRKVGKEVRFEDVKPFVQEVYGDKLREAIVTAYRPRSKIEIAERK